MYILFVLMRVCVCECFPFGPIAYWLAYFRASFVYPKIWFCLLSLAVVVVVVVVVRSVSSGCRHPREKHIAKNSAICLPHRFRIGQMCACACM